MRDLIDGYFALRQKSAGLKDQSNRFEALRWHNEDGIAVRKIDGWKLSVYRIEGQIEVCVTEPKGQSSTYS